MRTLLALAVVGLTTVVAPAAEAHPDYHYTGGCRYVAVQQPDVSSTYEGVMVGAVVAMRDDQVRPAPLVPINVTCEIRIGGVPVSATPQSATTPGAAATAGATSYTAAWWETVELCTKVDVGGEAHQTCDRRTQSQVPPEEVYDEAENVLLLADTFVCFVLGTFAPGVPGVVDITPAGDLTVAGTLVYDCGNPTIPVRPAQVDYAPETL